LFSCNINKVFIRRNESTACAEEAFNIGGAFDGY